MQCGHNNHHHYASKQKMNTQKWFQTPPIKRKKKIFHIKTNYGNSVRTINFKTMNNQIQSQLPRHSWIYLIHNFGRREETFFIITEQSAPLNQAISSNYSLKSVSYINYLWFFLFLLYFLSFAPKPNRIPNCILISR